MKAKADTNSIVNLGFGEQKKFALEFWNFDEIISEYYGHLEGLSGQS